jgi:ATP-binding cassette subfamily G (WHITE) protein 2
LSSVSNVCFFIYFYSKADETEESSKTEKPIIEKLAEFYVNSSFYRETKAELDKLSMGERMKKSLAFKETTYVTSFCHQLRWITRRSFKNLLGNPQASIAQVTDRLF